MPIGLPSFRRFLPAQLGVLQLNGRNRSPRPCYLQRLPGNLAPFEAAEKRAMSDSQCMLAPVRARGGLPGLHGAAIFARKFTLGIMRDDVSPLYQRHCVVTGTRRALLASASPSFPTILCPGIADRLPLHVRNGVRTAACERHDAVSPIAGTGAG
jgi:hypothetical protein